MFKQQNSPISSPLSPEIQGSGKKRHRTVYVIFAVLAVLIVIIAGALLIPQIVGSSLELSLNYTVGDRMVYETTNIVITQMVNTSLALPPTGGDRESYTSTIIMDVLNSDEESYTINQTVTMIPDLLGHTLPSITLNINKTSYYNNFLAPGAPLIFYNVSNPTILAYLAQPKVKVGDVWNIPVNTGNANSGLTGEVTLKFAEIQKLTVPAGTFQTMRIEVTSNALSLHSDDEGIFASIDGMSVQLNGTSYIEMGTCRLIKADLTQQVATTNLPGAERITTSYTERTLVEYTKP
ncbi:MAG: DUF3108 domain-containing protein [Nitrososphaerota archaeon]|nr:DUF3108 domain-containing protein [Nitrososphaerota archaeon]